MTPNGLLIRCAYESGQVDIGRWGTTGCTR